MRGPIDIKGSDRSGTSVIIPILCPISVCHQVSMSLLMSYLGLQEVSDEGITAFIYFYTV